MRNRHHHSIILSLVSAFVWVGIILPVKACILVYTRVLPLAFRGARMDFYRMQLRMKRAYLIYKRDH